MEPPHPQLRKIPWSEEVESPLGPASALAGVEGPVAGSQAGSGWRSRGLTTSCPLEASTLRVPCLSLWLIPGDLQS